jgi:hypothetical protein
MSLGRTKVGDDIGGGGGEALGRESEKREEREKRERERRRKARADLNFPPVTPTGLARRKTAGPSVVPQQAM